MPDRPVRVIYVDPTTGLPMRSIFARADKLDKPIFEATYSYPADIKIDIPKGPGPGPAPGTVKPGPAEVSYRASPYRGLVFQHKFRAARSIAGA